MREDAFRAFLAACGYTAPSQASRLSRARTIEKRLRVDLDALDLSDAGIEGISARLTKAGLHGAVLANFLNAARTYARFRSGEAPALAASHFSRRPPSVMSPPSPHPRTKFAETVSVAELMNLYADVLEELRARGVTRTANGPIGDYTELLFSRAFGWKLTPNSAAAFDAEKEGVRYQIKGRRIIGGGARQLGAIRRLPDAGFDVLAAALFDRSMRVFRAALIPHEIVVARAKWVEHTNSWRFMLVDDVWTLPTVLDATEALRSAARSI